MSPVRGSSVSSLPVDDQEEETEEEEKVESRAAIQLAAQLAARQSSLRKVLLAQPTDKGSLIRDPPLPGIDDEETDVEGDPDAAPQEGIVEGPEEADLVAAPAEGAEEGHESPLVMSSTRTQSQTKRMRLGNLVPQCPSLTTC
jgi:hypothetical protein